jgi:hypothetical protein
MIVRGYVEIDRIDHEREMKISVKLTGKTVKHLKLEICDKYLQAETSGICLKGRRICFDMIFAY